MSKMQKQCLSPQPWLWCWGSSKICSVDNWTGRKEEEKQRKWQRKSERITTSPNDCEKGDGEFSRRYDWYVPESVDSFHKAALKHSTTTTVSSRRVWHLMSVWFTLTELCLQIVSRDSGRSFCILSAAGNSAHRNPSCGWSGQYICAPRLYQHQKRKVPLPYGHTCPVC